MRIIDSPEDRTELALETESFLCENGRFTSVSALTFSARMPMIYLSGIQEFLYMSNYPSGNFTLISDIDLNGREIGDLSRFSGTFNGAGHTLSGFLSRAFVVGKNTGTIRNIIMENASVNGLLRVNNGSLEKITVRKTSCGTAVCETNNAKKRTFVDFGSVFGYVNCDHIVREVIVSGAFTVRSDGYEKVNFGVISGSAEFSNRRRVRQNYDRFFRGRKT